MLRIMLSLDLTNANDNRADFYKYLHDAGWKKVHNVDTVWLKETNDTSNPDAHALIDIDRKHIADILINAHKNLKLEKIFYVAQIGNATPINRVVEKRGIVTNSFNESLF